MFGLTSGAFAACPSGWTSSDTLEFFVDSSACRSGFTETTDFVMVAATEPCPSGFVENTDLVPIICHSGRGNCSTVATAFICN